MEEENEDSSSLFGAVIGLLIFVAAIFWIGNSLYEKYYLHAKKKPFWEGTELVQVCKTPYYSSEDCYKLNTTLIDNKTAKIQFPNGGYKVTYDVTCYFAGKSFPDEPRYIFCRSWDSENEQWDFMPVWVNYPSIEDISKSLEKYKD